MTFYPFVYDVTFVIISYNKKAFTNYIRKCFYVAR
jgi:hypothetical protein